MTNARRFVSGGSDEHPRRGSAPGSGSTPPAATMPGRHSGDVCLRPNGGVWGTDVSRSTPATTATPIS
jgi:hypothetical protein